MPLVSLHFSSTCLYRFTRIAINLTFLRLTIPYNAPYYTTLHFVTNSVCRSYVFAFAVYDHTKRLTVKNKKSEWRLFWVVNITGINRKHCFEWNCPNLQSTVRPILRSSDEYQPSSTSNLTNWKRLEDGDQSKWSTWLDRISSIHHMVYQTS